MLFRLTTIILCFVICFLLGVTTLAIDKKNLTNFNTAVPAHGTGPGGNEKTGECYYGGSHSFLDITKNNNTCFFENEAVKTINMDHSENETYDDVFSYECSEATNNQNTIKEINGAYSPLNDAHHFGNVVFNMYNYWLNIPPLNSKVVLRTHYGDNYNNAFWNGSSSSFGDGGAYYYPIVSLDVIAHEISHGFTEQNSNLIYSDQSGAINEAFSDIAGEAAEAFERDKTDLLVQAELSKFNDALRYMDDPSRDGKSVVHLNDYDRLLGLHANAGIFNKAFYLMVSHPSLAIKDIFLIFARANQYYWTPNTNFMQAAQGVVDAAIAEDFSIEQLYIVQDAFENVGIITDLPNIPNTNFTYSRNALNINFTDTSHSNISTITSWVWHFGDGTISNLKNPSHNYQAAGRYRVRLSIEDSLGDTYVKTKIINVSNPIETCDSRSDYVSHAWIKHVQFGNFLNASGTAGKGYDDYTYLVIDAISGDPITVLLKPDQRTTAVNEFWKVWADLNRDGDFTDEAEELFSASDTITGAVTGSITIPESAESGDTILRVSMKYASPPSPCETFTYGEVEDYTLRINNNHETTISANFEVTTSDNIVSFTDSSSVVGGTITSWSWNFGDGQSSNIQHPVHSYITGGNYDVVLTVEDSNGNQDSLSQLVSVTDPILAYCTASGNSQHYEYIASININGTENNSEASSYTDFTDVLFTLKKDILADITLTPGFPNSAYAENWVVWIDLNRDGDFDDVGETLFTRKSDKPITGSFTIPFNAVSGLTRMRIAMQWNDPVSSCGNFTYGEVEDYIVQFN